VTQGFDILLSFALIGMAMRLGWGIGSAVIDTMHEARKARAEQRERHE
jgi:IMP dehydrogenase/GMP reductase